MKDEKQETLKECLERYGLLDKYKEEKERRERQKVYEVFAKLIKDLNSVIKGELK